MKEYLKDISLFLVIGIILQSISVYIDSAFLSSFLDENLITLLLALMAINTTTISVIMTKLREITEKNKVDFSRSIKSMKSSIIEQVILVSFAGVVLLAKGSTKITGSWSESNFVFNVLLIAIFAYAIDVLYDTANGVFVMLKHENNESMQDRRIAADSHEIVTRHIFSKNSSVQVEAVCSCGYLTSSVGVDEDAAMKIIFAQFEEHSRSSK